MGIEMRPGEGDDVTSDDPWILSKEVIEESPSRADGVSPETETRVLESCVRYILELGDALDVPQLTRSAAIKLFQRFFMIESMGKNPPVAVATACLFIACKVQECVKRLRDVIFWSIRLQTRSESCPEGVEHGEDSLKFKMEKKLVLAKERDVFRCLNFEFDVDQPYKHMIAYVKKFHSEDSQKRELIQAAWNLVNDSLKTYLLIEYSEKEIAVAALHLATLLTGAKLVDNENRDKPWYSQIGVDPMRVIDAGNKILDQYGV